MSMSSPTASKASHRDHRVSISGATSKIRPLSFAGWMTALALWSPCSCSLQAVLHLIVNDPVKTSDHVTVLLKTPSKQCDVSSSPSK